jgi:hypothetical protein
MHEPVPMQSRERKRERPGISENLDGFERAETEKLIERLTTPIFKEERYFALHLGDLGHPRQPFDLEPLEIERLGPQRLGGTLAVSITYSLEKKPLMVALADDAVDTVAIETGDFVLNVESRESDH